MDGSCQIDMTMLSLMLANGRTALLPTALTPLHHVCALLKSRRGNGPPHDLLGFCGLGPEVGRVEESN
jgi:hypothetical protein